MQLIWTLFHIGCIFAVRMIKIRVFYKKSLTFPFMEAV